MFRKLLDILVKRLIYLCEKYIVFVISMNKRVFILVINQFGYFTFVA